MKKEIFKKIILDIKKISTQTFIGSYKSVFKGEGIDFVENKEYTFGDSIKNINWNLWAKYNKLYTKIYQEDRNQRNLVILDASSSMFFQSTEYSKMEIGLAVASILLYSSNYVKDKYGFILFSDKIDKVFPFKSGDKHFFSIFSFLQKWGYENSSKSCIRGVLEFVFQILKKRTNIFFISDFISDQSEEFIEQIKILGSKHNFICFQIIDPFEIKNKGFIKHGLDLESQTAQYDIDQEDFFYNLKKKLQGSTINYLNLYTNENYILVLKNYFMNKLK